MFQSKEEKKKNSSRSGEEEGWVVLRGSRLGRLSDALGISRDLGPRDEFAAVRKRRRRRRRTQSMEEKRYHLPALGILLWS